MSKILKIHPETPQNNAISKVVSTLKGENFQRNTSNNGQYGVIAYPTSSGFALGCMISNQKGVEKIRQIRNLHEKQDFTLMCADISQASKYAKIDDSRFLFIKSQKNVEDFTFLLPTLPLLPKKTGSKRGTVGIRIAQNNIIKRILEELNEPILSTSLLMPNEEGINKGHQIHQGFSRNLELSAFNYAWQIDDAIGNLIDLIVELDDSNNYEMEVSLSPTTVIDLTSSEYEIIREGKGEIHE